MAQKNYSKAYESYQQAAYVSLQLSCRDKVYSNLRLQVPRRKKPGILVLHIGVLYYQINQYRDALDAYSRAIRLNPYISEVW